MHLNEECRVKKGLEISCIGLGFRVKFRGLCNLGVRAPGSGEPKASLSVTGATYPNGTGSRAHQI